MELSRGQTIKDLQEIVDNYSGSWQRFNVLDNALTLIKELTEENEVLNLEKKLLKLDNDMLVSVTQNIKADTVKKMQTAFEERLDISVCGYSTEEVVSDVLDTLDWVAKEILEEKN